MRVFLLAQKMHGKISLMYSRVPNKRPETLYFGKKTVPQELGASYFVTFFPVDTKIRHFKNIDFSDNTSTNL